jgi:peroxiredoxin Q/BCP
MIIQAGTQAPDFELMDDSNQPQKLSNFRGKVVILYFYPKDDTPGCTTEACNFREDYSEYERLGITILGISPDTVKSHSKFKAKYHLPFKLLADIDHKICDIYGTWGPKKFMGKSYEGVLRTTFIISPEGIIQQVYENVKPAEHSNEILKSLKESGIL